MSAYTHADATETKRRLNNEQRLLALLSDKQWHTSDEMIATGGNRFGARLGDLKEIGLEWEAEHVKDGKWRYRAVRLPGEAAVTTDGRGQALLPLEEAA